MPSDEPNVHICVCRIVVTTSATRSKTVLFIFSPNDLCRNSHLKQRSMTAVKLCYTHKHFSAINTKLTVNTYHYSDIVKQDEWQLKSSATPHTVLAFATKIFVLKLDSSTIITLFVSFLQSIYDRILVSHLFLQLSRTNGVELLGCRLQLDKDYGASCTVPIP